MSGLKAVVLEKNGTLLTVLSSDGAFQKFRYKSSVEIGEELTIPALRKTPTWRIFTSVAAIFLVVFMGVFGWSVFQPGTAVAMLSLDINPSLQLTLDQKGRVLELESLNPDAEQLLSGLTLKGEPWEKALSKIIEQSVNLHYLDAEHTWVLVGYSPMKPDRELSSKQINSDEIAKQVEGASGEKGISSKVAVYELTAEEKVQAQEKGLTLGEYALVNTAKKIGLNVEPEAIKKMDERGQLLEKPEIQDQMKKENRIKVNEKKALPSNANPNAEKGQDPGLDKATQPSNGFEKDNTGNNAKKAGDKTNAVSFPGQSNMYNLNISRVKDLDANNKNVNVNKDKNKDKVNDKDKDTSSKNDDNNRDKNSRP